MLGNVRVLRRFMGHRKVKIGLIAVLILAGYFAFICMVMVLQWGMLPNYFRAHSVLRGYQDTFYLLFRASVSWHDFAFMLINQPIFEFGLVQREYVIINWLFQVTVLTVLNLIPISVLLSVYFLLLVSFIRHRRHSPTKGGGVAGVAGVAGSSLSGIMGSAVTMGSCCGASSVSIFLSSIGLSGGVALLLAENSALIGLIGLGILLLSILWLSGRIPEAGAICATEREGGCTGNVSKLPSAVRKRTSSF